MTSPPPTKSPNPSSAPGDCADAGRGTLSAVRPEGDAEGVLSALPFTVLAEDDVSTPPGPRPVAWLHLTARHRRPPTSVSACACGRHRTAAGPRQVLALIADHAAHRTTCPHLTRTPETRNAA